MVWECSLCPTRHCSSYHSCKLLRLLMQGCAYYVCLQADNRCLHTRTLCCCLSVKQTQRCPDRTIIIIPSALLQGAQMLMACKFHDPCL